MDARGGHPRIVEYAAVYPGGVYSGALGCSGTGLGESIDNDASRSRLGKALSRIGGGIGHGGDSALK